MGFVVVVARQQGVFSLDCLLLKQLRDREKTKVTDACGDGGFVPRRYDHAGDSCLLIVRLIAERRHHGTKTMPDLGVHEQHIRALVYVDKLGDKQLLAVK